MNKRKEEKKKERNKSKEREEMKQRQKRNENCFPLFLFGILVLVKQIESVSHHFCTTYCPCPT